MVVLGIEEVSYTNNNGQQINGKRLHLGYEKESCKGYCVTSEFIPQGVNCDVEVDNVIELLYNKFGKVVQICNLSC